MKKKNAIMMILISISMMGIFTGCSKDDDDNNKVATAEQLIGTWKCVTMSYLNSETGSSSTLNYTLDEGIPYYTFDADGSGKKITEKAEGRNTITIKWILLENKLSIYEKASEYLLYDVKYNSSTSMTWVYTSGAETNTYKLIKTNK